MPLPTQQQQTATQAAGQVLSQQQLIQQQRQQLQEAQQQSQLLQKQLTPTQEQLRGSQGGIQSLPQRAAMAQQAGQVKAYGGAVAAAGTDFETQVAQIAPEDATPQYLAQALTGAQQGVQSLATSYENQLKGLLAEKAKIEEGGISSKESRDYTNLNKEINKTQQVLNVYQGALSGDPNSLIKGFYSGNIQSQADYKEARMQANIDRSQQRQQQLEVLKQSGAKIGDWDLYSKGIQEDIVSKGKYNPSTNTYDYAGMSFAAKTSQAREAISDINYKAGLYQWGEKVGFTALPTSAQDVLLPKVWTGKEFQLGSENLANTQSQLAEQGYQLKSKGMEFIIVNPKGKEMSVEEYNKMVDENNRPIEERPIPEARQSYNLPGVGTLAPMTLSERKYYGSTSIPSAAERATLEAGPYGSVLFPAYVPPISKLGSGVYESIKNINLFGKPIWAIRSNTPTYSAKIEGGALLPEYKIAPPREVKIPGSMTLLGGKFVPLKMTIPEQRMVVPTGQGVQNVYGFSKGLWTGDNAVKNIWTGFTEKIVRGGKIVNENVTTSQTYNLPERGTAYWNPEKGFYNPSTTITTTQEIPVLKGTNFFRGAAADILNLVPFGIVPAAKTAAVIGALSLIPGGQVVNTLGVVYGLGMAEKYSISTPEQKLKGGYAGQSLMGFAPAIFGGVKYAKKIVWDLPDFKVTSGDLVPRTDIYVKQEGVTGSKRVTLPNGETADMVTIRTKDASGKEVEIMVRAADLASGVESLQSYRFVSRGPRPIMDIFGFKKPSFVGKGVEINYKTNFGRVEKVAKFSQKDYNKAAEELVNRYKNSQEFKDLKVKYKEHGMKVEEIKAKLEKLAETRSKDFLRTTFPQDIISQAQAKALVSYPPERFVFAGARKDVWQAGKTEAEPGIFIKNLVRPERTSKFEVAGELFKSEAPKEGYYTKKGKFIQTGTGEIGKAGTKSYFKTSTKTTETWKPLGKQTKIEEGVTAIELKFAKDIGDVGLIQVPGFKKIYNIPKELSFERYGQADLTRDITFPFKKGKTSASESGVNVLSYEPRKEVTIDWISGKKTTRMKVDNGWKGEEWKVVAEENLPYRITEVPYKAPPAKKVMTQERWDKIVNRKGVKMVKDIQDIFKTKEVKTEKLSLPEGWDEGKLEILGKSIGQVGIKKGFIQPPEISLTDKISPTKMKKESIYSLKLEEEFQTFKSNLEFKNRLEQINKNRLDIFNRVQAAAGEKVRELTPKIEFKKLKNVQLPRVESKQGFVISAPTTKFAISSTFLDKEQLKNQEKVKSQEKLNEKLNQKFIQKLNLNLGERLDMKLDQKLNQKLDLKLNQELTQKLEIQQVQRLNMELQQRMTQKMTEKVEQRIASPVMNISVPIPTIPKIKPIEPIIIKTKKQIISIGPKKGKVIPRQQGFTVQVRSRKKYGTPFNISVPRDEAFAIGAKAVTTTAAATFKIVPSKLPYRPMGIRATPTERVVIRPGKKPGEFVQKERLRIITPGEVKEISYVGAAARRSGSRSKSNNMWGF